MTEVKDIKNYLDLLYKHPRKASKKFREISPTELKITLYEPNLEIVKKYPWNVSKNFRKISHQELEISQYLCNFSTKLSQLTD